ncbi:MAG: Glycosyl transferase group 1 [Candidatus Uhrbacteria bacterium GW2011_GWF2_39_13]|uniref:Glycosyl transferase group 1 n=1 Tax=Candidatus Uhrbacteria bacterium GW2011_GWF2_39_13 TaxID=1618995 RepID=A0A0G0MHX0_9BACT|nr:MAG: Glycosyl transferase group 1 [Candidatus Uhrbacteria bacterium GW2011_GWF2_39_13]
MKLLIIHYHLQPGGVTRIIDSQLLAMSKFIASEDICILTGEPCGKGALTGSVATEVLPELNYIDSSKPSAAECASMLKKIEERIKSHISPDTVIHPHNINLGKNPVLTYAVHKISETGIPVLNHCHDFAEDGRPENLEFLKYVIGKCFGADFHKILYPDKARYLFGVLNSTDFERLLNCGVRRDLVNLLPNPVHFPEMDTAKKRSEIIDTIKASFDIAQELPIFTYPVRAIHRKNIGEFILLASLFADKANWIITLSPQNPLEKPEYEAWKDFCRNNDVKVFFEVGEKIDFNELMHVTDRCVTTSMKEGFGMVFLESWDWGVPVVGRNIPAVTRDFISNGLSLPHLYGNLFVETETNKSDFPQLTLREQMKFILSLKSSAALKEQLLKNNPGIMKIFQNTPDKIIKQNMETVKNSYSLEAYGKKLFDIYTKLSGQS